MVEEFIAENEKEIEYLKMQIWNTPHNHEVMKHLDQISKLRKQNKKWKGILDLKDD